MIRNSRQRNCIRKLLMERTDHPTAAMIYEDVKKEYPNISLGTVYRNLNLMVEMGEIRKVNCDSDSEHYDGVVEPHPHHICIECGAIHDVELADLPRIRDMVSRCTDHEVTSMGITLTGTCTQCRSKYNQKGETV